MYLCSDDFDIRFVELCCMTFYCLWWFWINSHRRDFRNGLWRGVNVFGVYPVSKFRNAVSAAWLLLLSSRVYFLLIYLDASEHLLLSIDKFAINKIRMKICYKWTLYEFQLNISIELHLNDVKIPPLEWNNNWSQISNYIQYAEQTIQVNLVGLYNTLHHHFMLIVNWSRFVQSQNRIVHSGLICSFPFYLCTCIYLQRFIQDTIYMTALLNKQQIGPTEMKLSTDAGSIYSLVLFVASTHFELMWIFAWTVVRCSCTSIYLNTKSTCWEFREYVVSYFYCSRCWKWIAFDGCDELAYYKLSLHAAFQFIFWTKICKLLSESIYANWLHYIIEHFLRNHIFQFIYFPFVFSC